MYDNTQISVHIPEETLARYCPREYLKVRIKYAGLPKLEYDDFYMLYDQDGYPIEEFSDQKVASQYTDAKFFKSYNKLILAFKRKTGVTIFPVGFIPEDVRIVGDYPDRSSASLKKQLGTMSDNNLLSFGSNVNFNIEKSWNAVAFLID